MKYHTIIKPIPVLLSALLLFLVSACGGPNDKEIQSNVIKELQINPDFKGLNASVKDGVVTLSGNCQAGGCDSLAAQQIRKVNSVKNIQNEIRNEATDLTLRPSVQSIVSRQM